MTTVAAMPTSSPRDNSFVFDVCDDPILKTSLADLEAPAGDFEIGKGTAAGPPRGALTPTRAKKQQQRTGLSRLRSLNGATNSNLDACYNDGSCGIEFVPLPDAPALRRADVAYNDGSCGMEFEPLRDSDSGGARAADAAFVDGGFGMEFVSLRDEPDARVPADAAYNGGSSGLEFVPLSDTVISRGPADAAYNDGSCGMDFKPLSDRGWARAEDAAFVDGGFGTAFSPLR